jgi:predicted amidohydrolase
MVKQDLNIATIQADLFWEQHEKNLEHFSEKIAAIETGIDVIILPEMFTTGFTMNTDLISEQSTQQALEWMKAIAEKKNAAICGSIAAKESDKFYNRLFWVNPDGNYFYYDKRHLFSLSDEPSNYCKGSSKLLVTYKGWKICPLICYDLRFPIWSRNKMTNGSAEYDLLIYVANWPEKRIYAWQTLLQARAIENQCYVAGVNRVGKDGNDINHNGVSLIIDPLGMVMQHAAEEEKILTAKLSSEYLDKTRLNLTFLKDGDAFQINY